MNSDSFIYKTPAQGLEFQILDPLPLIKVIVINPSLHLTFFNRCSFPLFYVRLCEFSTFSTKRRLTFSKFEVFEFRISSMFESVIENKVGFQQSNRIIEKIRFSLKLDLCRDRVRRRFRNVILEQRRSSL